MLLLQPALHGGPALSAQLRQRLSKLRPRVPFAVQQESAEGHSDPEREMRGK